MRAIFWKLVLGAHSGLPGQWTSPPCDQGLPASARGKGSTQGASQETSGPLLLKAGRLTPPGPPGLQALGIWLSWTAPANSIIPQVSTCTLTISVAFVLDPSEGTASGARAEGMYSGTQTQGVTSRAPWSQTSLYGNMEKSEKPFFVAPWLSSTWVKFIS